MFLTHPPHTAQTARLFQSDLDDDGYVSNFTRLWAWRTDLTEQFIDLRKAVPHDSDLQRREFFVMACAIAATLGDSYCAFAFGSRLASAADAPTAAAVLRHDDPEGLTPRERALAGWARKVVRDPNGTTQADVDALRAAGLTDKDIFEATAYIGFRVAFATVNDALGARPDRQMCEAAPQPVREAITFGRRPDLQPA